MAAWVEKMRDAIVEEDKAEQLVPPASESEVLDVNEDGWLPH